MIIVLEKSSSCSTLNQSKSYVFIFIALRESKIKPILQEKQTSLELHFWQNNNPSDSLCIVILRMMKNSQELKCLLLNLPQVIQANISDILFLSELAPLVFIINLNHYINTRKHECIRKLVVVQSLIQLALYNLQCEVQLD